MDSSNEGNIESGRSDSSGDVLALEYSNFDAVNIRSYKAANKMIRSSVRKK